jgi:membrane protein DedA with SNARE-associated domain
MYEFLESIWTWLTEVMTQLGYAGVVSLMALESSFFPFPSEVVVPPAAASAHRGEMSLILVIVAGIAGSLIGALFNYWLALKLGRPFLMKYGKYVLISEKSFAKSERFFLKHGEIGTFVGRLLPGIRQVISFPAGLARMPLGRFLFFTGLGSGIWVTILALIGYQLEKQRAESRDVIKEHLGPVMLWMIPALVLLVVVYVVWQRRKRGEEEAAE